MRILHLIPTLEGGGAERQLAMLAVEQSARGSEVHIGLRRCHGVYSKLFHGSSVVLHEIGDYRSVDPRLFFKISSLIRKLKPEVVQTWLPQMDFVGGAVANLLGVPWVLSERTSNLAFKNIGLITYLRRRVARYAQAVVANGCAGAVYWQDILTKNTLLKIIPNAVDATGIRNVLPINSNYLKDDKATILIVGRLIITKGIDVILQAIRLLPNTDRIRFIIMGDGPLRYALEDQIKAFQIGNHVMILPFQLNWWDWLIKADALISMSQHEGSPNVVLEAMAAGCPLIVSDIPAHREILSEFSASFVPCGKPIELATAIQNLLADPDASRIKALSAKEFADGLTVQRAADAYEEVYTIVSGKKGTL